MATAAAAYRTVHHPVILGCAASRYRTSEPQLPSQPERVNQQDQLICAVVEPLDCLDCPRRPVRLFDEHRVM